jgi:hypothetical protein
MTVALFGHINPVIMVIYWMGLQVTTSLKTLTLKYVTQNTDVARMRVISVAIENCWKG